MWRVPIRGAIYLYVGLNSYADVDVPIILGQSLFELLAWTLLVQDRKVMEGRDFLDFSFKASGKLRKLLEELGIPCAIPTECNRLIALSGRAGWEDAPHALTAIRNELVHPTERFVGVRSDFDARMEARLLTGRYAELCILALLGYRGPYGSRLREGRWIGDVEPVPWAKQSTDSSS